MDELQEELALRKQFGDLIKQRYLKILNNIMSKSECIPAILHAISKETHFNEMKKAFILSRKDLFDQTTELIDSILLSSAATIRAFIQQLDVHFPAVYKEIISQEHPLEILDEFQCLYCHILQGRSNLSQQIKLRLLIIKR
jgi:hypothetical protein